MSAQAVEVPPECCGAAMVHNTFTGEYECADAYFYLDDEGLLTDLGELRWWSGVLSPFDFGRHAHWRASRIPDGWDQ